MPCFKNIVYTILILLLLSYTLAGNTEQITSVTYRAEFKPFGDGLTWKKTIPTEGGALGLDFNLVFSPGTVTAELVGAITFNQDAQTITLRGIGGHLSSDGGVVLTGDIVIDFIIPLPEAFFGEDDDRHINHTVPIPGFPDINKGWNESTQFKSFLLSGSTPESVKLDIGIPELVTQQLSAVEIVPVVVSAILSGGALTPAAKILADNLSDYLDAGIQLNGGLASELTLTGKAITVNGTSITRENQTAHAPSIDLTQAAYPIQSSYDEQFTYTLDFVASSDIYAKVAVLRGIEIWSYENQFAEKRIPITSENTFNLDFNGESTVGIRVSPELPTYTPPRVSDALIPDGGLESVVREALNIPLDKLITRNAMLNLKTLDAKGNNIYHLTGLEYAVNLTSLNLASSDYIIDVSPLSRLTNLTSLNLYNNSIIDVSPLSRLTNLTSLNLSYNSIVDVPALAALTNLTYLDLSGNVFSEVSLSGLTNLTELDLSYNTLLSEVSLSGLTNLTELDLSYNTLLSEMSLSGLTSLTRLYQGDTASLSKVSLSGLTSLTELGFLSKSLSKVSLSGLTNLTQLGLYGKPLLSEVSLLDLTSLTRLNLGNNPSLSEVSLSGLTSLRGVLGFRNLLSLSKVSLSDLTTLKVLDLRNTLSLSEVSLSNLPNLGGLRLDNTPSLLELTLSDFPNLTTLTFFNSSVSKVSLSGLTNLTALGISDMPLLSELDVSDLKNLMHLSISRNTSSLSKVFLSDFPNLTSVHLNNSSVSEVSLSDLPSLTHLYLNNSSVSEVSLSDLPSLTHLYLNNSSVSEVSLSDLPSLTHLYLNDNSISDVPTLAKLRNLTLLSLNNNSISDVSALLGLTNLSDLYLEDNSISDVSTLAKLRNLTLLSLNNNSISDVSALAGLTNLTELHLYNNSISDVSTLAGLTNLTTLDLINNPLDHASHHIHIPAMLARGVEVWWAALPWVLPTFVKISGEDQTGTPGTVLPIPFVVQALDAEEEPMPGVSIKFAVYQGRGTLSTTTATTDATGKAQTTLTLGPNEGTNKVAVIANGFEAPVSFTATGTLDAEPPVQIAEDVNGDGIVNIQDLVLVSSSLGQTGENEADVNGDGVVNIQDLVLVSAALQ